LGQRPHRSAGAKRRDAANDQDLRPAECAMSKPRLLPGTPLDRGAGKAYPGPMIRYFDMSDRARLPWRFARETRSISARPV